MKKKFIITIDTEGDNLWKVRNSEKSLSRITNKNGAYLERFQVLCEKYGFVPTYLTNYEMALSEPLQELAKAGLKDKKLEIGMHLHAFNSPPLYSLPDRRGGNKAYAGEYPAHILEQKVDYLTKLLEDTFQTPIKSHRGGRWYLDRKYVEILTQKGYIVDCTVTPGLSWHNTAGQTKDSRGTDYRLFPRRIYDISKDRKSQLIEVPVTIKSNLNLKACFHPCTFKQGIVVHKWFRPTGNNLEEMKKIVDWNRKMREPYIEFMIHSSELMPGGSPTFGSERQIEKLYCDLEELFSYMRNDYTGIGLTEFAYRCRKKLQIRKILI